MQLTIALSLTLVCDKAFNHGELATKLFAQTSDAEYWVVRASEHAAHSVSGF
ncbi:hypothetical protein HJG53_11325 [Sphingomonas sp. ID1715]|nr:hypothetical protein [Sphingomonas sp. ID1715]